MPVCCQILFPTQLELFSISNTILILKKPIMATGYYSANARFETRYQPVPDEKLKWHLEFWRKTWSNFTFVVEFVHALVQITKRNFKITGVMADIRHQDASYFEFSPGNTHSVHVQSLWRNVMRQVIENLRKTLGRQTLPFYCRLEQVGGYR